MLEPIPVPTLNDAPDLINLALPEPISLDAGLTLRFSFDPKVSDFAASDSAFASVGIATANPDITIGIVFDFVAHMIRLGPFNQGSSGDHQVVFTFSDQNGAQRTLLRTIRITGTAINSGTSVEQGTTGAQDDGENESTGVIDSDLVFMVKQNEDVTLDLTRLIASDEDLIGVIGLN